MAEELSQKNKVNYAKALIIAEEKGWIVREESKDGRVIELMGVDEKGQPIYYETTNVSSAQLISTHHLHDGPFNLEGEDMVIGQWDAGHASNTHEQLAGRVSVGDHSALDGHATAVCGTMIANGTGNSAIKGMAPKGRVVSYDWTRDEQEMAEAAAME